MLYLGTQGGIFPRASVRSVRELPPRETPAKAGITGNGAPSLRQGACPAPPADRNRRG